MNVNPGKLNKRICILKRECKMDPDGYETEHLREVHRCFARFTRTSGTEVLRANADFSDVKCRFLIRMTKAELDRKMIVRYAGADYEIVYLNNYDDSNEYIEIWARRLSLEAGI